MKTVSRTLQIFIAALVIVVGLSVASVRVLEKLGMARTREDQVAGRPILYYALTREAYLRKRTAD